MAADPSPPAADAPSDRAADAPPSPGTGTVAEVFRAFLALGLTSFGGPIAHLAYFHREFVLRRRWLDEASYAQLLALCQFLPGPASSQLGFSIGLLRAGWGGALGAWLAFTLPSALLLVAFAASLSRLQSPLGQAALHGLALLAVAIVAQGVLAMAKSLAPDGPRRALALAATALLLLAADVTWMPWAVIAAGALLGPMLLRVAPLDGAASAPSPALASSPARAAASRRGGAILLASFATLLALALAAPWLFPGDTLAAVAAAFYRAGALVFGGGHVVLPLLQDAVVAPGWVAQADFLAGYGAAQAVPGPLFTFAAFLGERLPAGMGGASGASVALLAIFLPGLLLVAGVLPFWRALAARPGAARAVAGANAAVLGLLAAALYDPLWTSAVHRPADLAIALAAFLLLVRTRLPVLAVVAFCVAAAMLAALTPGLH
jgi:chromate transporter